MALVTVVKCGDDMRKASEMRSFTEKKTEKISLSLKYGNYIQACVNMPICLGSQPITMHNYHPGITMEIGLRLWFNKHFWFANAINLCTNASAPHQHQPPHPNLVPRGDRSRRAIFLSMPCSITTIIVTRGGEKYRYGALPMVARLPSPPSRSE